MLVFFVCLFVGVHGRSVVAGRIQNELHRVYAFEKHTEQYHEHGFSRPAQMSTVMMNQNKTSLATRTKSRTCTRTLTYTYCDCRECPMGLGPIHVDRMLHVDLFGTEFVLAPTRVSSIRWGGSGSLAIGRSLLAMSSSSHNSLEQHAHALDDDDDGFRRQSGMTACQRCVCVFKFRSGGGLGGRARVGGISLGSEMPVGSQLFDRDPLWMSRPVSRCVVFTCVRVGYERSCCCCCCCSVEWRRCYDSQKVGS